MVKYCFTCGSKNKTNLKDSLKNSKCGNCTNPITWWGGNHIPKVLKPRKDLKKFSNQPATNPMSQMQNSAPPIFP